MMQTRLTFLPMALAVAGLGVPTGDSRFGRDVPSTKPRWMVDEERAVEAAAKKYACKLERRAERHAKHLRGMARARAGRRLWAHYVRADTHLRCFNTVDTLPQGEGFRLQLKNHFGARRQVQIYCLLDPAEDRVHFFLDKDTTYACPWNDDSWRVVEEFMLAELRAK